MLDVNSIEAWRKRGKKKRGGGHKDCLERLLAMLPCDFSQATELRSLAERGLKKKKTGSSASTEWTCDVHYTLLQKRLKTSFIPLEGKKKTAMVVLPFLFFYLLSSRQEEVELRVPSRFNTPLFFFSPFWGSSFYYYCSIASFFFTI